MKLKPLSYALVAVFSTSGFCGTTGARAAGIATTDSSLTGSYSLAGNTQSSSGSSIDLTTTQAFVDCLCAGYSGYVTGSLAGNYFGLQAVSDQIGIGTASETFTTTVVNNGTTPAAASFTFDIPSATLISSPLGPTAGSDGATLSALINVNGQTAWSYSATLTGTAPSQGEPYAESFALVTSGGGLAPQSSLFQNNQVDIVTFADYAGSISLGTLAPGQSEVISYTLQGETFSSFVPGELQYYGGALAQIGDPPSVAGQPLPPPTFGIGSPGMVAAVPEPGTEVMFGAGLALLGALAARRKRAHTIY